MGLLIGSHVSFNKDKQLLGCVIETLKYGGNTFMFYTGAPQNTKRGAINDELTMEAYQLMKENNMLHNKMFLVDCTNLSIDEQVKEVKKIIER